MDIERVKKAAQEYHEELFNRAELFKEGSWLESSDEVLLSLVKEHFSDKKDVQVLDLGCGVGRNTIPIAKIIKPNGGKVKAVDILEVAVKKLQENAKKYDVAEVVDAEVHDIEGYIVTKDTFDLIVAHSVLEQGLNGKETFLHVLESLKQGTKEGGINYLGITTQLEELDAQTLENLPADIGFNAKTEEMQEILKNMYADWQVLQSVASPYEERYMKNGRLIIWRANFVMFAAQK